jgi:hypothetical protein
VPRLSSSSGCKKFYDDQSAAITGMHLHFPGFAHLVRRGSGNQLIPEAWEQTL